MYEISGKYSSIVCLDFYLIFLFSAPVHPPITLSGRVSRTQIDQAALEPSDQSYMDKIEELRDVVKTVNSEKAALQEKVSDLVEKLEESTITTCASQRGLLTWREESWSMRLVV